VGNAEGPSPEESEENEGPKVETGGKRREGLKGEGLWSGTRGMENGEGSKRAISGR
jgi:hypothetical protein